MADSERLDEAALGVRDGARRGMVTLALDVGCRTVVAVVVGSAVVRHLGPTGVGTLGVALACTTIVRATCGLGFDALMTQHIAADSSPRAASELALRVVKARLWATAASLPLMLVLGLALRADHQDRLVFALVAIGLAGGPIEVGWFYLLGAGRSSRAVPARLFVTLAFGSARVVAVVTHQSIVWFAALAGLELVVPELVALRVARREGLQLALGRASRDRDDRSEAMRAMLRGTWAFSMGGLFYMLLLRIDVVLVDRILGTQQAGRYSAVTRVSEAAFVIGTVIVAISTPHIAAHHAVPSSGHDAAYRLLMTRLLWFALVIAAVVSLFAAAVVRLLLGPSFDGVSGTLAIHVWSLAPVFVNSARARFAIDRGLLAPSLFNGVTAAMLNIGLNLVLLPRMGIQGAAWATVVSYTASVTVIPQLDRRQRDLQRHVWQAILPRRR